MYNKELASKILDQLDEAFPKKLQLDDLHTSLTEFSGLTDEDWLTAIDALFKSGWIQGIPLRSGFYGGLKSVANLEISDKGREQVRELRARVAGDDVKVRVLISRVHKFHDDLEAHFDLWQLSLEQPLPDYPVRNIEELREQSNSLARQLGWLRPYIERLTQSTTMGVMGQSWDAYDSAVSNDVAARKGPSIEAVLPQLQQMIGWLESMNADEEFRVETSARRERPQTVNIYNLQGSHSRVNIQSEDRSVNVSSITQQQVFSGIRDAITQGLPDNSERRAILEKLDALEESVHSHAFISRYQEFINAVASYMTIIQPFMPALAQMLGG